MSYGPLVNETRHFQLNIEWRFFSHQVSYSVPILGTLGTNGLSYLLVPSELRFQLRDTLIR